MKLFSIFGKVGSAVSEVEKFLKLGAAFIRGAKALKEADLDKNGIADVQDIEKETNVLEAFLVDRCKFHAKGIAEDAKAIGSMSAKVMKRVADLAAYIKTESEGK